MLMLGTVLAAASLQAAGGAAPALPADPKVWIGEPQSWARLRGQVVLLDVWAFGCVNCVNTLPWVRGVHEKYGAKGVRVIGVHTPEFGYEKKRDSVEAEIKKHGLVYPIFLDNDMAYWDALKNQYWPTTYLVDKCGKLREKHIGEVHAGEATGNEIEAALDKLLAEPRDCPARP